MILVKEGVRFRKLIPEIYNIFFALDMVFENRGVDCVITSANDSTHSPGSLHYLDRAIDLRSHHLQDGVDWQVVDELRQILGADYQVLFEDEGMENEHIHLEWDVK